jgi:hypothetical protein
MKPRTGCFPFLVALAAFASAAEAAVVVTFNDPDKYADVGRSERDRQDVLAEIGRHLQRLGEALPADRTVKIEVLDIDLAGDDRPRMHAGRDIRVLRGSADWPSMRVRYVVETAGKAGEPREETISDPSYLMHPITRPDVLSYEKRMLEKWFRARLLRAAP